jgi:hypothetical protein
VLLAPRRPHAVYRGDGDGILIDVDPATQTLTAVSVKAFDIVSLGGRGGVNQSSSHIMFQEQRSLHLLYLRSLTLDQCLVCMSPILSKFGH